MVKIQKLGEDGKPILENGFAVTTEVTDDHYQNLMRMKKPMWRSTEPDPPKPSRFKEFAFDAPDFSKNKPLKTNNKK